MGCSPHEYGDDGKCRNCDEMTNDAFWALIANGLGMKSQLGAVGLRLRPGKEPVFINSADAPEAPSK